MPLPKPPKFALAFFRWFCHPAFCEEIEGDLLERFDYYLNKYGYTRAKWLFIKEVFLLLRPNLIRNFFRSSSNQHLYMKAQNKRLLIILLGAALVLAIPFVAMKFTAAVQWSFSDFIVAGILLFGTGILLELILRRAGNLRAKVVFSIALVVALFLVWAELAVGVFGTPLAGS